MLKNHPTLKHILGRAGWYFVTFLVAVTINFFLPRLGKRQPGRRDHGQGQRRHGHQDCCASKRSSTSKSSGSCEVDAQGKVMRGTDGKPMQAPRSVTQFVNYLGMSLRGDLGSSILQHPKQVSDIIKTALPWTLALQLPTIIFGWLIGNVLGALAAYKRGVFDKVLYPMALLTSAIPAFCFGILLVYVFGIRTGVVPGRRAATTTGSRPSSATPSFRARPTTTCCRSSRCSCSSSAARPSACARCASTSLAPTT